MSSMPNCLAGRGRVPDLDGPIQLRHLKEPGSLDGHERLRLLWYRLRLTVQKMNYATRWLAELQCPDLHRWASLRGNGPSDENMVCNDGSVDAETIVTFIAPPGAPIREDAPPPPGCIP